MFYGYASLRRMKKKTRIVQLVEENQKTLKDLP